MARITTWDPEDDEFWQKEGKFHARRNLAWSALSLHLAFAVWMVWSVVAVRLDQAGFHFTKAQLFWLPAIAGLVGASFRLPYSFLPTTFGGRTVTAIATALLAIPCLGTAISLQNPDTPWSVFMVFAALSGFGGGAFASSMSNISFFYPKRVQGTYLGLNAGIGNLGVSVVQLASPIVITFAVFGSLSGSALDPEGTLWLQNAALVFIPVIVISTAGAAIFMDNLPGIVQPIKEQLRILRLKHTWVMTYLYILTFGSFIGYSAAFPLLIKVLFEADGINPLYYAWLGPLVGSIARPVGGWLSDKWGGAKVTFWNTVVMIASAIGVTFFIQEGDRSFIPFLALFLVLFTTTGIGNGSTFRMIPIIFKKKETGPVLGWTSAIAAYGAFFIPMLFGQAVQAGNPAWALYGLSIFYVTCLVTCWWYYYRKGAEVPC